MPPASIGLVLKSEILEVEGILQRNSTEHHLVRSLVDPPHLDLLDGLLRSASDLAPWHTVAAPCVVRLEVLMALVELATPLAPVLTRKLRRFLCDTSA